MNWKSLVARCDKDSSVCELLIHTTLEGNPAGLKSTISSCPAARRLVNHLSAVIRWYLRVVM